MSLTSYRAAPPRVGNSSLRRVSGVALRDGRRAWRRPTLPPLREAVPSALRVFTAEFGMGSGVLPLAMATRPGFRGQESGIRDQEPGFGSRSPVWPKRVACVSSRCRRIVDAPVAAAERGSAGRLVCRPGLSAKAVAFACRPRWNCVPPDLISDLRFCRLLAPGFRRGAIRPATWLCQVGSHGTCRWVRRGKRC